MIALTLLLLLTAVAANPTAALIAQWPEIDNVASDVHGIGEYAGAKLTRICPMAFSDDVNDACHAPSQCYSSRACRTLQNADVASTRLMLDGRKRNKEGWHQIVHMPCQTVGEKTDCLPKDDVPVPSFEVLSRVPPRLRVPGTRARTFLP
jgi:hypothetical protein